MTAAPKPAPRVVILQRAEHPGRWPAGYWQGLVGCGLRMPALVSEGRVLSGYLVAVEEGADAIRLMFEGLAPED